MVSVDKLNRSQQPQPPLFPVASEVEVSSDEEGFHGAWFVAKVLPLPPNPPSNNSLFVEYKTLVSDEKRSKPLREFADISFVRPLPPSPSESEKAAHFDLNDAVDAYHLDGWWSGVVTEVLALNKYKVSFPNPPDLIEFEQSSLRLHRDWVDGRWVVPKKQIMSKLSLAPGTAVEVNLEVDCHFDIWYPGTVSKVLGEGLYAVKYDSLNKVGGHDEVVVKSNHIRPSPPRYNHKTFQLLDKVEAFCNSGWSSGVVTRLLSEERYIVYFKHTRKEKELHHSDLRLPVLWNDGKWVPSSQNSSVISNCEEATAVFDPCANGEPSVPSDASAAVKETDKKPKGEDLAVPSGNLSIEGTNMSTTGRVSKKSVTEGNATPSRAPKKQVMEGNGAPSRLSKSQVMEVNATPDVVTENQVMEGNAVPVGESKHSSKDTNPEAKLSHVSVLMTPAADESTDNIGSGIKTSTSAEGTPYTSASENTKERCVVHSSQDSKLDIKEEKGGSLTNEKSPSRRRGWPKGKPRGTPKSSLPKIQKETAVNESLPCSDSLFDGSCHVPEEKTIKVLKEEKGQLSDFVQHGDVDYEIVEKRIRKRGRPFGSKKRAVGANTIQEHTKHHSGNKRRRNVRVPAKSVGGSAFGDVVMAYGAHTYVSSKVRKVKTTTDILCAAQELQCPLGEKAEVALTNRVANIAGESQGGTSDGFDDDRPLSTWCLEVNPPPLASEPPKHNPAGNASQNGVAGERNNQASKNAQLITKEMHVTGMNDIQDSENVDQAKPNIRQKEDMHDGNNEDQSEVSIRQKEDGIVGDPKSKALPFIKTSSLWEMIESMDIFKQLPQEPHFHPLYSCIEHCREGLAIGGMVTFTGLVEKIPKFQLDDPKSTFESSIETLVDLERHGFDVAAIRSRLKSLLEIKSSHEQSQNQSKETENLITGRCQEKAELNNELTEIDRQIEELRLKRAALVLKKERNEAEVVGLESSVAEMKKSIELARSEFERVAGAPW